MEAHEGMGGLRAWRVMRACKVMRAWGSLGHARSDDIGVLRACKATRAWCNMTARKLMRAWGVMRAFRVMRTWGS